MLKALLALLLIPPLLLIGAASDGTWITQWSGPTECGPYVDAPKWITELKLGTFDLDDPYGDQQSANCDLSFLSFNPDGSSNYSWTMDEDWSKFQWAEVGTHVPATVVFYGDKFWNKKEDSDDLRVLGVQDFCLNTTKPFKIGGQVSFSGVHTDLTAALYYGITGPALIEFGQQNKTGKYKGHYSRGQDYGVLTKDFVALSNGKCRFHFDAAEVKRFSTQMTEYDETYIVMLYDKDGWEVGSFTGREASGFYRERNSIMGEMSVTGTPAYMRVVLPGQPGG